VKCSPEEISETVWGINRSNSTKRVYEIDSFGATSFVKNSRTSFTIINNTLHFHNNPNKKIISFFNTLLIINTLVTELDTFGPFQLDLQLNQQIECKPDDWAIMAIGKAKERGISLRGYHHFIFVLPDSDYLHRTVRFLFLFCVSFFYILIIPTDTYSIRTQ
jgi:hypothetical protein